MERNHDKLDTDWLRAQLDAVMSWVLDIAEQVARDDVDDLDAIDNVRWFVRDYFAGKRSEIPFDDLLTTLSILMGGVQLEGDRELMLAASRATYLVTPERLATVVRCPGVDEDRHRCPSDDDDLTNPRIAI